MQDPLLLLAPQAALGATATLGLSGFLALLREALRRSVPSRVLEPLKTERARQHLEPLLARAETLAASAGALQVLCALLFLVLWIDALAGVSDSRSVQILVAVALAAPLELFFGEMLPHALAKRWGDALLRRCLRVFAPLSLPVVGLVGLLQQLRDVWLRLMGITSPQPASTRTIVEDLRGVIEESDFEGELDETEREIIENVIEFHDADVAEVMTPRTEISAVDVGSKLEDLVRTIAKSGHSRIPVFSGSLDRITGIVSARDIIGRLADDSYAGTALADLARPPIFVPETKMVSELLEEFRRDKTKIAVVLDEYGGTAGLVTMGDLLAEIVGDFHDEWDTDSPEPIRHLGTGVAEVRANHRISEVNEELDLDLPEEEDYETLAGFVLSELGHLPRRGEAFVHAGVEYTVLEATDRQVLRVAVRRLSPERLA